MCSSPSTKDGKTFACRSCNECVAGRRAGWVSRAMAERAMTPHTLAITLTYGNETQHQRDGAAMFRYADVAGLLKRLRRQVYYKTGKASQIRYLCAGEQGDRNGRCHWHLVIFSQYDLMTLGEFHAPFGRVTSREQIISPGSTPRRRKWSLWPHGFVVVQEPDEGGIRYAISYALKDQFAMDKAKNTGRALRAENFSAGMFRMSKSPPIGWTFLQKHLSELWEKNSIPPKLEITVPDSRLKWYPTGAVRRLMLETIRLVNERIRAETGSNAPQWSTLLHNLKDNPNDMEILTDGEETEDEETAEFAIAKRNREAEHDYARKKGLRRCGSTLPCNSCLRNLAGYKLRDLGAEPYRSTDGQTYFRYEGHEDGAAFRKKQSDGGNYGINPYCGLQGTAYTEFLFGAGKNRTCSTQEEG